MKVRRLAELSDQRYPGDNNSGPYEPLLSGRILLRIDTTLGTKEDLIGVLASLRGGPRKVSEIVPLSTYEERFFKYATPDLYRVHRQEHAKMSKSRLQKGLRGRSPSRTRMTDFLLNSSVDDFMSLKEVFGPSDLLKAIRSEQESVVLTPDERALLKWDRENLEGLRDELSPSVANYIITPVSQYTRIQDFVARADRNEFLEAKGLLRVRVER